MLSIFALKISPYLISKFKKLIVQKSFSEKVMPNKNKRGVIDACREGVMNL